MTVRHLHRLLRRLDDTREVVVPGTPEQRDLLHAVWRSAQDEANSAYATWCELGDRRSYLAYQAATDRADAALAALADR
jgi:hypothetical protein